LPKEVTDDISLVEGVSDITPSTSYRNTFDEPDVFLLSHSTAPDIHSEKQIISNVSQSCKSEYNCQGMRSKLNESEIEETVLPVVESPKIVLAKTMNPVVSAVKIERKVTEADGITPTKKILRQSDNLDDVQTLFNKSNKLSKKEAMKRITANEALQVKREGKSITMIEQSYDFELKGCTSNVQQTTKAREVEAKKCEEVQAKATTEAIQEVTKEKRNDEKQNLAKIRLQTEKSETEVAELVKIKARREAEEQVTADPKKRHVDMKEAEKLAKIEFTTELMKKTMEGEISKIKAMTEARKKEMEAEADKLIKLKEYTETRRREIEEEALVLEREREVKKNLAEQLANIEAISVRNRTMEEKRKAEEELAKIRAITDAKKRAMEEEQLIYIATIAKTRRDINAKTVVDTADASKLKTKIVIETKQDQQGMINAKLKQTKATMKQDSKENLNALVKSTKKVPKKKRTEMMDKRQEKGSLSQIHTKANSQVRSRKLDEREVEEQLAEIKAMAKARKKRMEMKNVKQSAICSNETAVNTGKKELNLNEDRNDTEIKSVTAKEFEEDNTCQQETGRKLQVESSRIERLSKIKAIAEARRREAKEKNKPISPISAKKMTSEVNGSARERERKRIHNRAKKENVPLNIVIDEETEQAIIGTMQKQINHPKRRKKKSVELKHSQEMTKMTKARSNAENKITTVSLETSNCASSLGRHIDDESSFNSRVTLDTRTSDALKVLQTSKRFVEVVDAVKTIEISTRLSYQCCEAFATVGAPSILYKFIHLCNRSLPHIELLQHILMTLANVSKISNLIPGIITNDCVDIFLDLLQMFRDKEIIFSYTSTLLRRIAFSDEKIGVSFLLILKFTDNTFILHSSKFNLIYTGTM
jgi:hypothetical protein